MAKNTKPAPTAAAKKTKIQDSLPTISEMVSDIITGDKERGVDTGSAKYGTALHGAVYYAATHAQVKTDLKGAELHLAIREAIDND